MSTAPIATAGTPAPTVAAAKAGDPVRSELREAAQQFEAILLRQMLASSRSTSFGGSELFGQGDDTFRDMRDARFAELASQSDQIGFAAAIERQLAGRLPKGEN